MKTVLSDYYTKHKQFNQLITVFVLTYNRSSLLKKTITSLLNQTYDNFYLIVLDNMSTDNTKSVVESFGDERIIYIQRSSLPYPNNEFYAFEVCRTQYIVVFHDDDIIEPQYLESCLMEMEEHKEYCALGVNANIIDENDNIVGVFNNNSEIEKDIYSGNEYFIHFIRSGKNSKKSSIIYPSVMYRHSFFGDKTSFYNDKIGPAYDQYVWFQTERKGGKIAVSSAKLMNYRIHQSQDSSLSSGYMDLKLFSVLMKDPYYKELIIDNAVYMCDFIRRAFFNNIRLFSKRKIRKKDIKLSFDLIDKSYVISKESKKWYSYFRFLKSFPSICCAIYKVFKGAKV